MADDISKEIKNKETEKFEERMKDGDLIAQIDAWERESEDLYAQLKRIWEQNLLYYYGIQTDVEKITGKQSKAVENRIWMAIETMIPIATARLPDVVVRSSDDAELAQMDAYNLQEVLSYQFERVGIQELAERFLRDLLIKRYGVFKVGWNNKVDDVELLVVDPRRIRIPKYGKSVNDLAFLIEYLELSYNQVVDYFRQAKADEALKNQPSVDTEGKKVRKKTLSITEVWTNDLVVWRCGSVILKKQKNPFFDFDNPEENFFLSPRKPYVIKSLFETEESVIGSTDYIQQVIPIQDNINIRKRQIENVLRKTANPILLIDSRVMSEEQAANITNEEGIIIYGDGAADGTKIRFEQPGHIANEAFVELQNSRQEFDNIWGIHSTTRGEREGKETATGRQLLRAADLGRIDLVARQLERALDEVAEYWTQLIKLFYTENKSFSILGEDGVHFIKNFSSKNVAKNVRPMVMAGSTLPKDEITIHNEAITLWQMKAIGIRTLYKMLKLPNIAEAIDDFIQTQSGAILQQQVASPMIPPPETTVASPQEVVPTTPPTIIPNI